MAQKSMEEMVADAVKASLPAAAALLAEAIRPVPEPTVPVLRSERCSKCGQLLRACKDKHRQVVCYPKDQTYAHFFRGAFLNGIKYYSDHGEALDVPADWDVESMISAWENNEREQAVGRRAHRNSGHLGNGIYNVNPNPPSGWR